MTRREIAGRWLVGITVGMLAGVAFEAVVFWNAPYISTLWTGVTIACAYLLAVALAFLVRWR